jgi:hypothetical protein
MAVTSGQIQVSANTATLIVTNGAAQQTVYISIEGSAPVYWGGSGVNAGNGFLYEGGPSGIVLAASAALYCYSTAPVTVSYLTST